MGTSRWVAGLVVSMGVALAAACGSTQSVSMFDGGLDGGSTDGLGSMDVPQFYDGGGGGDGGPGGKGPLSISPLNQVINVTVGTTPPVVHYLARIGSAVVPVSWSIDRGELGTLGVTSGDFKAGQTIGGTAHVTATYGKQKASTSVTVFLHFIENGATTPDGGTGAGGNGGVGGNGPGGPVSGSIKTVLNGKPTPDATVGWLYPYDKTVWPQGILAPLLQWNAGAHDFDAVYVHITEAAFDYKGYFAKTATPFVNEPIPEPAWTALTYSNGGEPVTVSLVFAAGGKAIGPITETWHVALGTLEGTVYYNSYGTNLAHQPGFTGVGGEPFGGATLGIKGGSTNPVLIAGSDTECRVCHSVAAGGSTLVTEQGNSYSTSSAYDLKTLVETTMPGASGTYAWPALYPDGTFLFSNSSPLSGATGAASGLYAVPGGAAIASTGLPAGLGAACPAFSPDGKHVAFNFYGGAGADKKSLAWLDFSQPKSAFSGLVTLYTPAAGTAVWPSFFPTNDGVLFELETVYNGRDFAGTRSTCDSSGTCSNTGTEGELWWVDRKTKTAARLDEANGKGYLPTGTDHLTDETLNYEPTVNPVPSGGYAWVVFTSRRLYGNVATINPYWSDPRFHDITKTPTTKKLWVAAIDLNPKPGTDPSHPAFYLPGQELLAGNSRGYWVVNPCLPNGSSCMTGDQCCGGYCRAGDGGALVCSPAGPGCSNQYEKCTKTSDCCGASAGVQCIDDICSAPTPK